MNIITVPNDVTQAQLAARVYEEIKTKSAMRALIILHQQDIPYGKCFRDGNSYIILESDSRSAEFISHGRIADIVAIQRADKFTEEDIVPIISIFDGNPEGTLMCPEKFKDMFDHWRAC